MSDIAADSAPQSPAASPKKRFWRRISFSTWLVMLLATGVMALVEVPGRRTGALTYAHGWPCTYLRRDYVYVPMKQISFATPTIFANGSYQHLDAADSRQDLWSQAGLPWEVEQQLNPWSPHGAIEISLLPWVFDLLTTLAIVLAIGRAHQAWRRRHPRRRPLIQFSLRTLLIAVAVVSICCARWMAWRNARNRELALVAEISEVHDFLTRSVPTFDVYQAWIPPTWLPESLVKLMPCAADFSSVTGLALAGPSADDEHLRRAEAFTELRYLSIVDTRAISAGWGSLQRFPRLTSLDAMGGPISDKGLKQVASLAQLTRLSLPVGEISSQSLRQLQQLTRLERLHLIGAPAGEGVEALTALPNLEDFELDDSAVAQIAFTGCPKLRNVWLQTRFANSSTSATVGALKSVRLESLPALESCSIAGSTDCDVCLHDLPKLRELGLGPATLDASVLQEIPRLSNLESIVLNGVVVREPRGIALHGMPKLNLFFVWGETSSPVVRLDDLPNLGSVTFENNRGVLAIKLGNLPKLQEFKMFGCPRVAELDLSGATQLRSLTATDAEAGIDTPPRPPDQTHRRAFHGLNRLARLKTVDLSWTMFDPAELAELGRLTTVTSLNLAGSRLTEDDLRLLAAMPKLEEFNLYGTNVSSDAIDKLQRDYPKLRIGFGSPTGPAGAGSR